MTFDLAFTDSIGDIFTPVSDSFTRTVSNGWGTSDSGHAWTTSGGAAADYSTTGTRGRISLGLVGDVHYTITGSGMADVNITALFISPPTATGNSIDYSLLARVGDSSNFYELRISYDTAGTVDLSISKRIGGTFTTLANIANFAAYTPGTSYNVRLEVAGSTIRGKIWAGTEPTTWAIAATDSDRTSGGVGIRAILQTGNTNTLPVLAEFDSFIASPVTQTRLDLNDDTPWRTLAEGTDFGTPPLRRAVASTLLQDGEQIPASAYGNRTLTLTLDCQEPTFDAAATAFQNLSRELDRPTNFLRYRPGTTAPVFFRTLRSDLQGVQWDPFLRRATVSILAKPFAHGLRETLPAVTVNNDPAAGSNGMFLDVSGVKGDVETPLRLAAPNGSGAQLLGNWSVTAVRRGGIPANAPFALQVESMAMGNDTTVQVNDPAMSGAGSNYARCTFATVATMSPRATTSTFPTSPTADARGVYRVFLRCRKSVGADPVRVQLLHGPGPGTPVANDPVTLTAVAALQHVDLGLATILHGFDPVTDGSGLELPIAGVQIRIDAERTSGTTTLDLDYLIFVPADDRLAIIKWGNTAAVDPAETYYADAISDAIYNLSSAAALNSLTGSGFAGGLPMASPGVSNRIYFVRDVEPGLSGALTETTPVTVDYFPRYLSVRPAST